MMEEQRKPSRPKTNPLAQFLGNEHAALQAERIAVQRDANHRIYIFLLTVACAVIALGFIGQFSGVGQPISQSVAGATAATTAQPVSPITGANPTITAPNPASPAPATTPQTNSASNAGAAGSAFFWFGTALLPALFFLGITAFLRAVQAAMEDVIYARGLTRIRNFYAQNAPEIRDYLVHSIHDDNAALQNQNVYAARSRLHSFVNNAGTAALINSILAGAWISFLLHLLFVPPVWLAAVLGIFLFIVSLAAHQFYQSRRWEDFEAHLDTPKFPSNSVSDNFPR